MTDTLDGLTVEQLLTSLHDADQRCTGKDDRIRVLTLFRCRSETCWTLHTTIDVLTAQSARRPASTLTGSTTNA